MHTPLSDRRIQHFQDMLNAIASIHAFVDGYGFEGFCADDKTRSAVERKLLIISEAATRLGPQAEALCPEVHWRLVRGAGNRIRHEYDDLDEVLIWDTVKNDLPMTAVAVQSALSRLLAENASK